MVDITLVINTQIIICGFIPTHIEFFLLFELRNKYCLFPVLWKLNIDYKGIEFILISLKYDN